MNWPRIVLTILLPPLSVYVRCGAHRVFWINSGLTLLGYLPGVFHAFWLLRRKAAREQAAGGAPRARPKLKRGRPEARPLKR